MSLERRLRKLEGEHAEPEETPAEREKRRRRIREQAEHANYCRGGDEPIFEITEAGDVLCARDGKPVTDSRQVLAEEFYWMEVGFGGYDLVHDEEEQAFYSKSGHLAVSRDRVDLRYLRPGGPPLPDGTGAWVAFGGAVGLRDRLRRLEREAEGEMVFVPQKAGTAKRFPKSALQETFMTNMKRLRGEDVPHHPLGVAAAESPDPEWSRSFYSAEWTAIVAPVEDLSEP